MGTTIFPAGSLSSSTGVSASSGSSSVGAGSSGVVSALPVQTISVLPADVIIAGDLVGLEYSAGKVVKCNLATTNVVITTPSSTSPPLDLRISQPNFSFSIENMFEYATDKFVSMYIIGTTTNFFFYDLATDTVLAQYTVGVPYSGNANLVDATVLANGEICLLATDGIGNMYLHKFSSALVFVISSSAFTQTNLPCLERGAVAGEVFVVGYNSTPALTALKFSTNMVINGSATSVTQATFSRVLFGATNLILVGIDVSNNQGVYMVVNGTTGAKILDSVASLVSANEISSLGYDSANTSFFFITNYIAGSAKSGFRITESTGAVFSAQSFLLSGTSSNSCQTPNGGAVFVPNTALTNAPGLSYLGYTSAGGFTFRHLDVASTPNSPFPSNYNNLYSFCYQKRVGSLGKGVSLTFVSQNTPIPNSQFSAGGHSTLYTFNETTFALTPVVIVPLQGGTVPISPRKYSAYCRLEDFGAYSARRIIIRRRTNAVVIGSCSAVSGANVDISLTTLPANFGTLGYYYKPRTWMISNGQLFNTGYL